MSKDTDCSLVYYDSKSDTMLVTVTAPGIMWLRHAFDYQVAARTWRLDEYINIEWSEVF